MTEELIELDDTPTGDEELLAMSNPDGYRKQLENHSYKQDIKERKAFADRAYGITQTWIGFLIVITISQFILGKSKDFGLTELEFNVVFTTTTASVFGFWLLVGKYLFRYKPETTE